MNSTDVTYLLQIDELNEDRAVFRSDLAGVSITLPRNAWGEIEDSAGQKIRPSQIYITVSTESPWRSA